MKFLEIIQPYIYIRDIQYNQTLNIETVIKGCIKVNSIHVPNFEHQILKQPYDNESNEHKFTIIIENVREYIPEIKISYVCDEEWKQPTNNHKPETHLVKMRTNANYKVYQDKFTLGSQASFQGRILNIQTTNLADKLIHMQPNNIFSVVYYKTYKASFGEHYVLFKYNGGFLSIENDSNNINSYDIIVEKFGTIGCCNHRIHDNNPYLTINFGQQLELSTQAFLELLGRTVVFKDPDSKTVLVHLLLN